jgi:hypothetical protein
MIRWTGGLVVQRWSHRRGQLDRPSRPGGYSLEMSAESTIRDLVALMRRSFASASRRDWDAVMSHFAPDAMWSCGNCVRSCGAIVSITSYNDVDEARAAAERLAESRG